MITAEAAARELARRMPELKALKQRLLGEPLEVQRATVDDLSAWVSLSRFSVEEMKAELARRGVPVD